MTKKYSKDYKGEFKSIVDMHLFFADQYAETGNEYDYGQMINAKQEAEAKAPDNAVLEWDNDGCRVTVDGELWCDTCNGDGEFEVP